jgi:hypothetical protein
MFKSHEIHSARANMAELYDLHHFESAPERLEFMDSLLADNEYLFPVVEHVEGGVRGPNPMLRELKVDNEWLESTLLLARIIPVVYLHQILSSGK